MTKDPNGKVVAHIMHFVFGNQLYSKLFYDVGDTTQIQNPALNFKQAY